jgi:ABC-type nitrate/sulfonate/bicarbonate transport system substrate-binding protein
VYPNETFSHAGLNWELDRKHMTMHFGAMPDALTKGQIGVITVWEPFYTVACLSSNVRAIMLTDLDVNRKRCTRPAPRSRAALTANPSN